MDFCAMRPQDIFSMSEGHSSLHAALHCILSSLLFPPTHLSDTLSPSSLEVVKRYSGKCRKLWVEANKAAWRNVGTPKGKLKHLITINSLNAVIITSWWYCIYKKHAQCAISSADVCHLQPLSILTVPVIFAFLWPQLWLFFFLEFFGCFCKEKGRGKRGEQIII